jgi:hypothetical protein
VGSQQPAAEPAAGLVIRGPSAVAPRSPVDMTLGGWLDVVRPHLAGPLAGEDAVARAGRSAERLPGDALGALEVRLGPRRADVVDLACQVTAGEQARAVRRRVSPPHLARFLAAWARGDHPEACSLWLEFDLEREAPARPVPGVCAALPGEAAPAQLAGALDRLLPALRGRPLPPPQRRCLGHCLAAVPAPGRLLYAGSMESRGGGGPVRLVIAGLAPPALARYLRRVAPAAVAAAAAAAAPLAAASRVLLSFDVAEEVTGRVGWECSYRRLPSREPGWAMLLARWTAVDLVTAAQCAALLAWPGYDSAWSAAPRWPPVSGAAAGIFAVRCLSHLKLVCDPAGPPAAKAYLLFGLLRSRRHATAAG